MSTYCSAAKSSMTAIVNHAVAFSEQTRRHGGCSNVELYISSNRHKHHTDSDIIRMLSSLRRAKRYRTLQRNNAKDESKAVAD